MNYLLYAFLFLFNIIISTRTVTSLPIFENTVEGSLNEGIVELKTSFSQFGWEGNDVYATQTFYVNLAKPSRIQVVDFKNRGDRFEVYDNDVWIGQTSRVEELRDLRGVADIPEHAIGDSHFSQSILGVSPGMHLLRIKAKGPYNGGTGAIRLL